MKKILVSTLLIGFLLSASSCEKTDSIKIDFTQSYEDAASTLDSAQKKYTIALATNDMAKIEDAKQNLQSAENRYQATKQVYVAKGGKVNPKYEVIASKSDQVLSSTIKNSVTEEILNNPDGLTKTAAQAVISSSANNLKVQKDNQIKDLKSLENSRVNNEKAKISEAVQKEKLDLKTKTENTRKSVKNKINESLDGFLGK